MQSIDFYNNILYIIHSSLQKFNIERVIMLVEFKISNFRSFKDEVTFSMEPLTQNGKNPNTINTCLKKIPQLYRTSGIFGANASGKSNILKAFAFLKYCVKKSSKFDIEDKFPQEAYALSDDVQPMSFSIQFIVKENLYNYNVIIFKNIVQYESLYYYPISQNSSAKANRIFERQNKDGKIVFDKSKGILQSWSNETLDNRLFLSEIVNNRKCKIIEILDAYNWITENLRIVNTHNINEGFSLNQISEGNGDKIIDMIKKADLGLENIEVKQISLDEIQQKARSINKDVPQKLVDIIKDGKGKIFDTKSYHKTENGELKAFDFDIESDGTKNYLALTGPVLDVLKNGQVLIVDELDDALHPYLVKYLVSMFNSSEINKNKAQLIFTSHAHYLMDGKHLSRDQIWFTSKELNDGFYSDLYSLSDFKKLKRKNIAFYDAYMDGIYGAVPFLERIDGKKNKF